MTFGNPLTLAVLASLLIVAALLASMVRTGRRMDERYNLLHLYSDPKIIRWKKAA